MTFGKAARDFGKRIPARQRALARDSAVLAKLLSSNVVVVDGLDFKEPSTRNFVTVLDRLKIAAPRSCLVATDRLDRNVYKSARNVPKVAVTRVSDLNAGEICSYRKMLFTKDAFETFMKRQ
jgi:large subunit ribosomal protein L4